MLKETPLQFLVTLQQVRDGLIFDSQVRSARSRCSNLSNLNYQPFITVALEHEVPPLAAESESPGGYRTRRFGSHSKPPVRENDRRSKAKKRL
jgi:hypothetical protein